jgi:di/tricarboxylate transporter
MISATTSRRGLLTLFVIGEGLVRTGVAQRLGDWLIAKAGRSEIRLMVLLMVVVCGLGATRTSGSRRQAGL